MDDYKKKALIKIIIGIVFTVISLFFIVDAIINSGNSVVVFVTLFIGIGFLYYGRRQFKISDKNSKFKSWYG